jgi:Domain of Unknown Function (DUF1206)
VPQVGLDEQSAVHAVGRVGLAARGVIYLGMALITASLAVHGGGTGKGKHADQRGAVTDLASKPFGHALVLIVVVGLAAYALWQLWQVFTGVAGEEDSAAKRVRSFASFVAYAALTVSAISVLAGAGKSQSSQQAGYTAKVMKHTGGRSLVGLVGVVVVIVGIVLIVQGVQASFMERMRGLSGAAETTVRRLGQVGSVGRGIVVALAGLVVVRAAIEFDPKKARGIDGALHTLVAQPFGRLLTAAAALGLLAFGLFGLVEAKYRKV